MLLISFLWVLFLTGKARHDLVAGAPTQRVERRHFDHGKTAVVDGQVADIQSEEQEVLQFGQVVVTEFQVEYDFVGSFKLGHRVADVLLVCELAEDVEAVLLDGTQTWRKIVTRWALVVLRRHVRPPPHQT